MVFLFKNNSMAKNFPYFKFVATEWLTGDIVFEDYELQGIFINICALYWHREANITVDDLKKRLKTNKVDELIGHFISVNEDKTISIKFLDEQLMDANHISKINSENGKKGAEAKRNKATAKRPLSDRSAKLSKEEKEEEKEINKNNIPTLEEFKNYALEKEPNLSIKDLELKYESWKVNGWKDGNDKKIANWKSKLLNTIPHLKKNEAEQPKPLMYNIIGKEENDAWEKKMIEERIKKGLPINYGTGRVTD
jgi:hypothetical protein